MQSSTPRRYPVRIASFLAVSALALGLSACGKPEEPSVGQRLDSTVEKPSRPQPRRRPRQRLRRSSWAPMPRKLRMPWWRRWTMPPSRPK